MDAAMVMACPQCKGSVPQGQRCPKCNVSPPSQSPRPQAKSGSYGSKVKWHQSPAGRVGLCLLMAVGLCYGLLLLCTAILQALNKDTNGAAFDRYAAWSLFAGLQALALLAAGGLAGAVQDRGAVCGATVGLLSGGLAVAVILGGLAAGLAQPFLGQPVPLEPGLRAAVMYGLLPLHVVAGGVGGLIGGFIWQPPVPLPLLGPSKVRRNTETHLSLPALPRQPAGVPWTGPVAWLRVLAGTGVAVLGGVFTDRVIDLVVTASEGYLQVATLDQNRVATGEVLCLAILLGGCIAGATTRNGLKQGLWVGLASAMLLGCLAAAGLFAHAGSLVLPVLAAVFLGPVGGWFGTELMPPANRRRRPPSWL